MSFNWLNTFRTGQWLALRKFVLEERKDVAARIAVIDAEISRLGRVLVKYAPADDGEVSERRVGFWVQEGSSLGKMVQAYIAMGGNPLDVSMFLSPDSDYAHEDGCDGRL